MENLYVITSWSSVSQMINSKDENIRASATYTEENQTLLKIYDSVGVLFKAPIESQGVWSLSNDEAVEVLNSYGFNCKYETPSTVVVSDKVKEVLKSLQLLGYNYITRSLKPYGTVEAVSTRIPTTDLSSSKGFDYDEWKFLRVNALTSISQILEGTY